MFFKKTTMTQNKSFSDSVIIVLNVGGFEYTTSRTTLTKYPSSMLARMFSGSLPINKDKLGRYFIDRDGTLFEYILQYLRTGFILFPEDSMKLDALRIESDFYMLENLSKQLDEHKERVNVKRSFGDIIKVNVGGRLFVTTRKTLTLYPKSLLGRIFTGNQTNEYMYEGQYFFDRDPDIFGHVLQFLRNENLDYINTNKNSKTFLLSLLCEARFFKIQELVSACLNLIQFCDHDPS